VAQQMPSLHDALHSADSSTPSHSLQVGSPMVPTEVQPTIVQQAASRSRCLITSGNSRDCAKSL